MIGRYVLAMLFCLGWLAGMLFLAFTAVRTANATPILEPWPHFEKYYVSPSGLCPPGYRPLYKGSRVVLLRRLWIPGHQHKPWPRVPGTMCQPDNPNQPLPLADVAEVNGSYQQNCTQCVQP